MELNSLELFLERARSEEPALGCCVTFGDPAVSELAADSGFDFCWIDGEHGVLDRAESQAHLLALRGTGCAPLVRVPANDHTEIKKVIDLAPAGIIVPMVNSGEEAARAVSACRYPPEGTRGCGFRRGIRYGADPLESYLECSKREPLVILQLEHIDGCRELDRILVVPGVGSILIGPYDLSASMNRPGRFDDPEFNRLLDDVCGRIRAAGILLGAYTESDFGRWRNRGVQYFGIVNDTGAMFRGFQGMMRQARRMMQKL